MAACESRGETQAKGNPPAPVVVPAGGGALSIGGKGGPVSAVSPLPQLAQTHRFSSLDSPSPPPRCASPVKASISVGQMGPPAPRPGRSRSPHSMPPPPPRQPSQDAGARKRSREGSPPLPGQGSPLPVYRRSVSPPPRPGQGSPHGSPRSIQRSSSPPLPGAGSPLRRPRSSSPPFENIMLLPPRQGSPIKVPRRSTSPPLPGQGQGMSAFKRPRSASPSDAGLWPSYPSRPMLAPKPRMPGGDRDAESSGSQRVFGPQRSGSSSSEEDRSKHGLREDGEATSSVQSLGRGASSSSSDDGGGARGDVEDSSTSGKGRRENEVPGVKRWGPEGIGASGLGGRDSPQNRPGAMLPPPPRQPKRMSLLPPAADLPARKAEPALSGESRIAHNSSDLAVAAASSSSTAARSSQTQDHLSTACPPPAEEPSEAVSLSKRPSDASSVIGAIQSAATSDASSVGRFRTPSPSPVSSGVTGVTSTGGHLAAGQSMGSAMKEDGDRASTNKDSKAQGFKEPAAKRAANHTLPAGRQAPPEGQAESAESGPTPGAAAHRSASQAQQEGVKEPESVGVLERVASSLGVEAKETVPEVKVMGPPKGSREMLPPRAQGGFKVPQQRTPLSVKPQAQAAAPTEVPAEMAREVSGSASKPPQEVWEDSAQEVAAVLVGQENEDRESQADPPGGQSKELSIAPPAADNGDAGSKPGPAAGKTLEPALRALFPAAMYKDPSLPPPQTTDTRANKAPPGQPPYEIPPWSEAPGHAFQLEVVKDGTVLTQLDVSQKGAYMFGRSDRADFPLEHATISRYHAVVQYKEGGQAAVFDLGSTHGTFVNKKQVKPRVYVPIHVGDVLKFGQSSRLYLFQGPPELMPEEGLSRAEKQQLKKLEAAQEAKMEEESLARARAAQLSEVTWGQMEDAEDEEEEEEVDDVTWDTYTGALTGNQEKAKEKVVKKREKIANLQRENEVIQGKEIAQGGLTPGQQAQVSRNEQRLEALTEELEEAEESLNESIRESLGAKTKRKAGGKKRGRTGSDEEEGDSDEDEFYNRAGAQKRKKKAAGGAAPADVASVETAESLLEKRDTLAREREVLQGEIQEEQEREQRETGAQPQEEDALDAFMSDVSEQIEKDKVQQLRRELELLDAEAARISRLLKIADPMGEAQAKWVAKAQPGTMVRRKFPEPVRKKEVIVVEEETKEEAKPRGLLQTPKVALGGGKGKPVKGASLPLSKQHSAPAEAAEASDRSKASAAASAVGVDDSSGQQEIKGGEGPPASTSEHAAMREPEAGKDAQGRKRKEADKQTEKPEQGGQPEGMHIKLRDREAGEGEEEAAEPPGWEPPPGQTGDGRSDLNDKFGY